MPLYDYECEDCGRFSGFNKMSDCNEPLPCPSCGAAGRRVLSAPNLACMSQDNRRAWERNERSAHEPMAKRKGCGCSGAHSCGTGKSQEAAAKPALQQSSKLSSRPWMLGH